MKTIERSVMGDGPVRKQHPPIILASASPRRRELMENLGLSFQVHSADVDESIQPGSAPEEAVRRLALKKAHEVAHQYTEGLVIGSDTIVVLDDVIWGKPTDDEDALQMLMALQGKTHAVYSGVAVVDAATGKNISGSEKTLVSFRTIDEAEIRRYIATGEPAGKAGAYAIQGLGAVFVKEIQGDYFNVVGLPLFQLSSMLKTFGLYVI